MKISVTQEHIDKGVRGDSYACPVALATKDVLGDFAVAIPTYIIHWTEGCKTRKYYEAPPEIGAFLKRFDAGKKVEPFEFELEEPETL